MKTTPRIRLLPPPRSRRTTLLALRGRQLVALDICAIAVSFFGALALRFDAPSAAFGVYVEGFWWVFPVLLVARLASFVGFGLYQRVWRYASIDELRSIVTAVATSSIAGYGLVYAAGVFDSRLAGFPRSIPLIEAMIATSFVGAIRFSLLVFGVGRRGGGVAAADRALIVGAGSAGVAVARQLMQDPSLSLAPVGFADDDEVPGHKILGLRVVGRIEDLGALIRQHGVGTVLLALPQADGPTLRRLVRVAEREGARPLTVPSMSEVLTGQITATVREIQMEDLLRRAPARTDLEAIRESFRGRDILITGAGGSIGSELCRQLLTYEPRRLLVLGRGENSIYDLVERLIGSIQNGSGKTEVVPVIMDVRDQRAISQLVARAAPNVVFHAAAHKHVSFMERYPSEAVATNVFGTANLLAASVDGGVERFVFVSTDKAVRPTSVMGASKRVAELLVRESAERSGRPFVTVRFGNVLSSRGSVVPRFQRQLAAGGPLTVTHPQVRRYFMTLSEAVQLILQATILGRCGETFVLDMGSPVLIAELARDLVELHGLLPGRDIAIEFTGLGPGEKLDEELFFPHERPRKTIHDSIWVAVDDVRSMPDSALEALRAAADSSDPGAVIAALRDAVPEYAPARDRVATLKPTALENNEGA